MGNESGGDTEEQAVDEERTITKKTYMCSVSFQAKAAAKIGRWERGRRGRGHHLGSQREGGDRSASSCLHHKTALDSDSSRNDEQTHHQNATTKRPSFSQLRRRHRPSSRPYTSSDICVPLAPLQALF